MIYYIKFPLYLVLLISFLIVIGCSPIPTENQDTKQAPIQSTYTSSQVKTAPPPTQKPDSGSQEGIADTPTHEPEVEVQPTAITLTEEMTPIQEAAKAEPETNQARVLSVEVKGDPGSYTFFVGVRSPDTGCDQYADWWEVVDQNGTLIYRRILAHSHVNEQPFVRSGGPVEISLDSEVIIRAHMNTSGYGTASFKGTVNAGFVPFDLDPTFAAELEHEAPLPSDCDF